ncbi:MAG: GNAT family N-acetyltransferase, partial [Marmoricola sp.]|nr:GNAT family N-acetyltransferase [Marmoricola sp.]
MRVPELSDGVVTLRAHDEDDVERIVEQCTDPLSIAWTIVPQPYTRDDAKRFVRHAMPGGWESEQEWGFAVEHAGRFAGTVSLRNRGDGRAEIAYGAHPDARGQGVMSRALRLLLAWGCSPAAEGGRDVETVLWLANRGNWA